MTKHEIIIQWLKIILAIIGFAYFAWKMEIIINLLQ